LSWTYPIKVTYCMLQGSLPPVPVTVILMDESLSVTLTPLG
jgi:hypothetical protein